MGFTIDIMPEFEEGLNSNSMSFKGLGITMENATGEMGAYEKALRKNTAALDNQITKVKLLDETQKKIDAAKPLMQKEEQVDPKEVKLAAKAAEALQSKFVALQESLMAENELEQMEYTKKLDLLNEYYAGRTMFDQNYLALREELESRHQKNMEAITKKEVTDQVDIFKSGQFQNLKLAEMSGDQQKSFAMQTGAAVLNEMGKTNKAAFKAAKAMNIALAIMNTAAGITEAFKLPFPMNFIVAGIVGVAGAMQIAAISSQQYQGKKTGGLVQGNSPYMVGEAGPEMFMPSQTGTIIPNGNLGGGGGEVTVNFNIEALDATGVDQLIMERRGLITNIIREATQANGQRSMV